MSNTKEITLVMSEGTGTPIKAFGDKEEAEELLTILKDFGNTDDNFYLTTVNYKDTISPVPDYTYDPFKYQHSPYDWPPTILCNY